MHGYLFHTLAGAVTVQCSQTNKQHNLKLKDLQREDLEPLTNTYLVRGAKLLMTHLRKQYVVQFVQFKGIYVRLCHNYSFLIGIMIIH